jgi:hypothetical protein
MRLPDRDGPTAVVLDTGQPGSEQLCVWRGVHDGAHLDYLAHVASEPGAAEYGAGLLAAEAYAMAVEVLAAAECALIGDTQTLLTLRAGLVERIGRLPGYRVWTARRPTASASLAQARAVRVGEFAGLPRLASAYVIAPLRLLGSSCADLPPALGEPLAARWRAACQQWPPAAKLTERTQLL